MAVVVMMLTGCSDYDADVVVSDEPVSVQLAYAFTSSVTEAPTRQAAEVVTSDETNPRPPQHIRMIPIYNNEPKQSAIVWEDPVIRAN